MSSLNSICIPLTHNLAFCAHSVTAPISSKGLLYDKKKTTTKKQKNNSKQTNQKKNRQYWLSACLTSFLYSQVRLCFYLLNKMLHLLTKCLPRFFLTVEYLLQPLRNTDGRQDAAPLFSHRIMWYNIKLQEWLTQCQSLEVKLRLKLWYFYISRYSLNIMMIWNHQSGYQDNKAYKRTHRSLTAAICKNRPAKGVQNKKNRKISKKIPNLAQASDRHKRRTI